MGLIHSIIFNAGHDLWPHSPEHKFDLVRQYCHHQDSHSHNCMCGIRLTGGAIAPLNHGDKSRDSLDLPSLLLQSLLK